MQVVGSFDQLAIGRQMNDAADDRARLPRAGQSEIGAALAVGRSVIGAEESAASTILVVGLERLAFLRDDDQLTRVVTRDAEILADRNDCGGTAAVLFPQLGVGLPIPHGYDVTGIFGIEQPSPGHDRAFREQGLWIDHLNIGCLGGGR